METVFNNVCLEAVSRAYNIHAHVRMHMLSVLASLVRGCVRGGFSAQYTRSHLHGAGPHHPPPIRWAVPVRDTAVAVSEMLICLYSVPPACTQVLQTPAPYPYIHSLAQPPDPPLTSGSSCHTH